MDVFYGWYSFLDYGSASTRCKVFFTVCKVEWETTVHDGPVTMMARSPFIPHLLITVGGYREVDEGSVGFKE